MNKNYFQVEPSTTQKARKAEALKLPLRIIGRIVEKGNARENGRQTKQSPFF